MDNLTALCKPDGLLLFSTLVSDGHVARGRPLTWWYASPRNGHISIFSTESLRRCFSERGLMLGSFNSGTYLACREMPPWAADVLGAG